jgi:hypothetical protein
MTMTQSVLFSTAKVCVQLSETTFILPKGRLQYPNLFKARAMKGESEERAMFGTSIILPADVDLRIAVDIVARVATEKWGPVKGISSRIKRPFLKHAEKSDDAELTATFPFLIRTSSKIKPTVLYSSQEPCTQEEEVYSGRWARLSVRAWAWDHPTGGPGVSLGLNNCLLLEPDDRLGGSKPRAEDEFAGMFETPAQTNAAASASNSKANKPFSADDLFG